MDMNTPERQDIRLVALSVAELYVIDDLLTYYLEMGYPLTQEQQIELRLLGDVLDEALKDKVVKN